VPRAVLEHRAAVRRLRWIDDDSNRDRSIDRNFLRHDVLPVLRRHWPDVDARLAVAAARFADDAAALRAALDRRLDALTTTTGGALPIAALDAADGRALARRWLERRGIVGVRERVLRELVRQAHGAIDRTPQVRVSARTVVHRHRDALHVVDDVASDMVATRWLLDAPLQVGAGALVARRGPGGLHRGLTCVAVRGRRGGEWLRPVGRAGSRSVKRLLQEARIAPWLRARYPLVYVGGQLAAVPGVAVDVAFGDAGDDGWCVRFEPRR
jgi:tRNA(Ile)-lysidine synthase